MRTLKDVMFSLLQQHSEALAAFYSEYRIETPIPNDSPRRVEEVIQEDFKFWENELKLLPIDSYLLLNTLFDFHLNLSRDKYLNAFESKILPILLKHWTFNR